MKLRSKPTLFFGVLTGFISVAVFLWLHFSSREDRIESVESFSTDETRLQSKRFDNHSQTEAESKKTKELVITPVEDSRIKSAIFQLNQMEASRASYCRSIEKDDKTIYQFLISRASDAEIEKIKRVISKVVGLTKNSNGGIITWRERLISEYLPDEIYENQIVSITYNKLTGDGRYSIIGVKDGNLIMHEGNAPAPADGAINFLASNVIFEYDSKWRFAYLFDREHEQ